MRVAPQAPRSHRNEGDEPVEIWAVSRQHEGGDAPQDQRLLARLAAGVTAPLSAGLRLRWTAWTTPSPAYRVATEAGDVEAIMATLAPDVELVSPISGRMVFRGQDDVRASSHAPSTGP